MPGAIGSRIFEGSLPIPQFGVTLAVEVADSDKHMAVRTGEGQQVSQGLAERMDVQRQGKEGSKETWERSWTGVGLIQTRDYLASRSERTAQHSCFGPYPALAGGGVY